MQEHDITLILVGTRRRRVVRTCEHCGTQFEAPLSYVLNGYRRFCSRACRYAAPQPTYPSTPEQIAARFWSKVDTSGEHWLWTASVDDHGYGTFNGGYRAHRWAWEAASGTPVPDGLWVLHTCDTPRCVRNDAPGTYVVAGVALPRWGHLFLGTSLENMRDMAEKGRHGLRLRPERAQRGAARYNAKLTPDTVRAIRDPAVAGISASVLAEYYGVSRRLINMVRRREIWRHVP